MITRTKRRWRRFFGVGLVLAVGLATMQGCSQSPPPPAASNPDDGKDAKPVVPKKAKLPKA